MNKQTVFRMLLCIVYFFIFSYYFNKINPKLETWIQFPIVTIGFFILIFLLFYLLKPFLDKFP